MSKKKNEFLRGKPKNKTGLTFSLIHKIVPFLIIFISFVIASQKCARDLGYDESIVGKSLFTFRGEPFYPPWAIFFAFIVSASKGHLSTGDIVYENSKIVAVGTFIAIIIYFVLVYVRSVMNKEDKNFLNTGRWGTKKDLKASGLLSDCGVVVGQLYDADIDASLASGAVKLNVKKTAQIIQYHTNVSGMLLAGSRLGKGISTVIPTCTSYPDSLICVDPKGENYEITAGFRAYFSYVYKFSPVNRETLRFNILDEISEEFTYRDANMIAQILTAPKNANSTADPHWHETAKVLITTVILFAKCTNYPKKSLAGVYEYLAQGCQSQNGNKKEDKQTALLKNIINAHYCREDIRQSTINYANEILSAPDEERGSIFSSALEALAVFNDPAVAYATDSSDFCLDDFKYSEKPISWYLTLPFSDLDRLAPLLRLIIEFVCRKFSQGETKFGEEKLKHRILFLIDEFPTLGVLETVETFAGILNGYGISFLFIAQSKAQIDKLYGQNAPIFEHCRFIWTYAMTDQNIAEYFSKRIGTEGIIKQNVSSSGNRFDYGMNNMSISSDITERPLMTATEIENLPPDSELIFTQGGPTILAKKIAYYSDPRFKDKVNLPFPRTRKELLKECYTSLVSREGEAHWYDVKDDDSAYPDKDIGNEIFLDTPDGVINTEESQTTEIKADNAITTKEGEVILI